jgi:hypothetical protein
MDDRESSRAYIVRVVWFPSELKVYAPKPYPYLHLLEFILLQ